MKKITLPPKLKTIVGDTFWGCKGLKSVIVPKSVRRVDKRVFWGCTELASITFLGKDTIFGDFRAYAYYDYVDDNHIYMFNGENDKYLSDVEWAEKFLLWDKSDFSIIRYDHEGNLIGRAPDNPFISGTKVNLICKKGSQVEVIAKAYGFKYENLE